MISARPNTKVKVARKDMRLKDITSSCSLHCVTIRFVADLGLDSDGLRQMCHLQLH
jgi:hypothetical protein